MQRLATLMIVVDEPLYRDGLQFLLARRSPNIRCIAVRTPTQALAQLQRNANPQLLVADYQLAGGVNGLSWLQQIGAGWPAIQRVLLSTGEDAVLAQQAQRTSLAGCFCKTMEPEQWLLALDVVLGGGRYFATPDRPAGPTAEQASAATSASPLAPLNERQISVLQLASIGFGNRQIAEKLHLTERTVKYHLSETFLRLASSSRTEAVAKAAALGLIRLQSQQISGA